MSSISVVTGASGAGKSAAVAALAQLTTEVRTHEFDTIGVPSPEEMVKGWGSPDAWQRAMIETWISRLHADSGVVHVLDAQVRPDWVIDSIRAIGGRPGLVILLDCAPEVRHERLRAGRGQPELVSSRMDMWAAYLRGQADALRLPIIDTTRLSPHDAALQILRLLREAGLIGHARQAGD